ncbi:MAG: PhnD/SsuA/transferrin family substrate-binding protein [Actinobacteria bacterium]|nr:PhnD/SsuA/transferrin family substrate-binding protein [Actinomycetota bacterium]
MQSWRVLRQAGQVDPAKVRALFTTPPYHDYHWVIGPDAASRYGPDFVGRVSQAFRRLDPGDPKAKQILELFGAQRFIPTDNGNYRQIEEIGRKRGLIS